MSSILNLKIYGMGPEKNPSKPKLLWRQWVALWKLTAGPHCLGQHPHRSLYMERSSKDLYGTFIHTFYFFGMEGNLQATRKETPMKTPILWLIILYCLQNMIGQWWYRTCNVWFDLRSTPWDDTYTPHCLVTKTLGETSHYWSIKRKASIKWTSNDNLLYS